MRKISKSLVVISITFVMLFSALLLYACNMDNRNLKVSSSIKTDTETIVTFIKDKIYNNTTIFGSQTNYSVQEIANKGGDYSNFQYYVEVGTLENFDNVVSINFNGTEYKTEDSMFKLSVGNSNFIVDKAFYVASNKLYVAAPIIAFESTANSKIKINDKELDLNVTPATEQLQIVDVKFQSGANGTVERVNNTNEFNATFKEFNKWLQISYSNSASTDIFLTKKVLDGKLLSYGFTTVDTVTTADKTDYVLAYYACPYYSSYTEEQYNSVREAYNGKTCEYYAYCVGKGFAKIRINYIIPQYQETL